MKFVDAPPEPDRTHKGRWAARLAPVRERPGEWAELDGSYNPGMASHIRNGNVSGAEPGEFEAVVRNIEVDPSNGRRTGTLYVRYVGDGFGGVPVDPTEPDPEIDGDPEWFDDAKEAPADENPFAEFLEGVDKPE